MMRESQRAEIVFWHGRWHVRSSPLRTGWGVHGPAVAFCRAKNAALGRS